jgi:hypothetical protein
MNINSSPITQQIDGGNFPAGFISSIQTGDNGQRILVTISNYGVQSVWQSLDGGNTWTDVEGNLPDMPIRWAIYHPQNPNQVMLATETGIWTTDSINANSVVWIPTSGFPNVRVDMLDVRPDNNRVIAGTHGRGLFYTTWNITTGVKQESVISFKVYPNPASDFIDIELQEKGMEINIFDLNGKLVKQFVNKSEKQRFNVSDLQKGYYLLVIANQVEKLLIR